VDKQNKIARCAIENCFLAGKTKFRKPVSCWLYPIRYKIDFNFSGNGIFPVRYLFYLKRKECDSAIENGEQNNVKLYQTLKEPLVKILGKRRYNKLEKLAPNL